MTRARLFLALLPLAAWGLGCGTKHAHRDPSGERFPSVSGKSLAGKEFRIPEDFAGEPVLLLVGYEQDTQFDIDRWLLGLVQAGIRVRTYELPTIPGLVPRMLAGTIDSGMRSGIPSEDWGSVITVYRDGGEVARFTGNENKLPGRVMLLDRTGRVVFFHDRGYSVSALQRLQVVLREHARS